MEQKRQRDQTTKGRERRERRERERRELGAQITTEREDRGDLHLQNIIPPDLMERGERREEREREMGTEEGGSW